ncbi:MAG: hypothetical protein RLP44_23590 [Aggregatilineales bacterium]
MKVIAIESLLPASGGSPCFEGYQHGATNSFFVVTSPSGKGADKHRHPYDETFGILQGNIEVVIDGVQQMALNARIKLKRLYPSYSQ